LTFIDILLYAKPPTKFTKKTTYVGCVELDVVILVERKFSISPLPICLTICLGDNELCLDKHDGTPLLKLNCVSDIEKGQWNKQLANALADSSSRKMVDLPLIM
jgi:hypothetical protein